METLAVQAPQEESRTPETLAFEVARWADQLKAEDIHVFHVNDYCSYADYVVVCNGNSSVHVQAITEAIRVNAKKSGSPPLSLEGAREGQWVLIDFGDVLAHVFFSPVREYYELDRMWPDSCMVPVPFLQQENSALV